MASAINIFKSAIALVLLFIANFVSGKLTGIKIVQEGLREDNGKRKKLHSAKKMKDIMIRLYIVLFYYANYTVSDGIRLNSVNSQQQIFPRTDMPICYPVILHWIVGKQL